ncbi:unnamed protein product [Musa textilis]
MRFPSFFYQTHAVNWVNSCKRLYQESSTTRQGVQEMQTARYIIYFELSAM